MNENLTSQIELATFKAQQNKQVVKVHDFLKDYTVPPIVGKDWKAGNSIELQSISVPQESVSSVISKDGITLHLTAANRCKIRVPENVLKYAKSQEIEVICPKDVTKEGAKITFYMIEKEGVNGKGEPIIYRSLSIWQPKLEAKKG